MKLNIVIKKKFKAAFYAKRYAAKEAFSKALGTGINKDINFKNIEICNDNYGKPFILLKGSVSNYLKEKIKSKNLRFIYHFLMIYLGLKLL